VNSRSSIRTRLALRKPLPHYFLVKQSFPWLIYLCFISFGTSSLALAQPPSNAQGSSDFLGHPAPSKEEVRRAIALSVGYLERACGPDGKFKYAISTRTSEESESYNIVRHAGVIYALAMYNKSTPDRQAVDVMVRAAKFMQQNYVGNGVQSGQLVVWSETGAHHSEAVLGATALGLIALAEVRRVSPETVPLNQLKSLGRFLLFLQKEDGSFVNKYSTRLGPEKSDILYYPGEAALAFVELYETDHSSPWFTAAAKALAFLAKSRGSQSPVPPDQWFLIATGKFIPYCKFSCQTSRKELLEYASRICEAIVRDQLHNPSSPMDGAFDPTGRTGAVATRLEGLLVATALLPDTELLTKAKRATGSGIAFLLRAQIKSGPFVGGIPNTILPGALGTTEIRIDNIQHSLSAYVLYKNLR
jgi:hypothetical protein